MEFLVAAAAGLMGGLCTIVTPAIGSAYLQSLCGLTSMSELSTHLSEGAHIYYPGSENFTKATARWSTLNAPNITLVVEVATENDVAETVKYANAQNVPFVAVNGGHGAVSSMGKVYNGVEIWLNQLNSISIAKDGRTATFGGGVLSKQVTDALWEEGKQTVTGGCECTSLLGPALGGGHGFLQGHYGLIADQFVSLNMVLANGSLINVREDSDLWWAVKGAGHNFGIVTSVTSKIYDVSNGGLWSFQSFIFTHDKVESVYEAINQHLVEQPADLINYSVFLNEPSIDADNAIIVLFILREGIDAVETQYTKPFTRLGPIATQVGKGTYQDLTKWTGLSNDAPPCQKANLSNIRFPVDIQNYNPAAQRSSIDTFSRVTRENPALNQSFCMFEGYSLKGVQEIPAESTAFPHREANLLIALVVVYEGSGSTRDEEARVFGESLRHIIFEGSDQEKLYAYVNYASGVETPESMYGYEPWRLERLRRLKAKYDPNDRFSFYAPFT
ncbi:FAD binding domain-containing protein [Paecilomyces variotii No. 5]|uniref:FAD binding domain-containing protein n=1 Tax=Byssochlamys spectabilis (strain No. 5 / NBRC 109023) TaxID=1356009 RepID=V5F8K6_BYSSN|nr:FAD binding domain-containing protein [Paecilomyces variotii No. 5]